MKNESYKHMEFLSSFYNLKGKKKKEYQLGYEEGYEAGYYDNKDSDE